MDGMDGHTLDTIMRKDRHVAPLFEGVYAADTLPRRLHKRPALLICNTDPIAKPGTHWVAFYIDKHGAGEFWDSYGMPPVVSQHRKFLDRVCKKWTYNHTTLQSVDSKVCGEYCVLYLVHRAHGYSLHKFVKTLFTKDVDKNDGLVRKIFKRLYSVPCILPNMKSQGCCARKKV